MILARRAFLVGLVAAPLVVRAASIMRVKTPPLTMPTWDWNGTWAYEASLADPAMLAIASSGLDINLPTTIVRYRQAERPIEGESLEYLGITYKIDRAWHERPLMPNAVRRLRSARAIHDDNHRLRDEPRLPAPVNALIG